MFYLRSNLISFYRFATQPKIAFIPQEQFLGEIGYLLHKVEQSFNKLKEYENRIEIRSDPLSLCVSVKNLGEYNFTTNVKERRLYLQTPFNLFQYYYDEQADQWKSVKDQHNMIENLTRETGKYLKGYLEF
ncbi:unnamed protein product (macronuclear) [Paramecium tetraurelia]|uniref:Uncharacterized protein n=1 Tax=Paramecium tetraurelia TaxID=5888 RepID=A0BG55_PARTE|nr:uncharacterized protein GSPATT00028557001 [Paramecium tetraurelia]CAK57522.1 unnamed protein product [Paramecium tetraurelia]|eukprot:XP_001424920.1 hypothetical protein (macronuclear) [Paramecium tetraurelia strain d4-2]